MKSNLFALLGAAVGFAIGGLITYKLLNRRHTSGSFRELYDDNFAALKVGEFMSNASSCLCGDCIMEYVCPYAFTDNACESMFYQGGDSVE